MKRLFQVNDTFFDNKQEAKEYRDTAPAGKTWTVSKGPDHMGNHGRRVPSTRHRAPQEGFAPRPR